MVCSNPSDASIAESSDGSGEITKSVVGSRWTSLAPASRAMRSTVLTKSVANWGSRADALCDRAANSTARFSPTAAALDTGFVKSLYPANLIYIAYQPDKPMMARATPAMPSPPGTEPSSERCSLLHLLQLCERPAVTEFAIFSVGNI